MKKLEPEVRNKMVVVRLNTSEFNQLQKFQFQTTERTISNYLRKLALNKPVVIKYRNQSADDFLRDMSAMIKELNAIGHNYNQEVKKLHLLEKIPEFRLWIHQNENIHQVLMNKVEGIEKKVQKLYELWSQK